MYKIEEKNYGVKMDLTYASFDLTADPKILLNYDQVFTTTRLLGKGGVSDVYLVKGNYSKMEYALKLIPVNLNIPGLPLKPVKLFAKEVAILKIVSGHPYVVKYFDAFKIKLESQEYYAILMEYVIGDTLEKISQQKLKIYTIDEIYNIAEYLFGTVSYLHKNGVAHRDIHEGNLILTPGGTIKLIDFGEACFTDKN